MRGAPMPRDKVQWACAGAFLLVFLALISNRSKKGEIPVFISNLAKKADAENMTSSLLESMVRQASPLKVKDPLRLEGQAVYCAENFLFQLDENGYMILPPGISRIEIEVGLDKTSELAPRLEQDPGLFVIAFEPMAERFKKFNPKLKGVKKFLLIPAVVTPNDGHVGLTYLAGCSSIEPFSNNNKLVAQLKRARQDLGACVGVTEVTSKRINVNVPGVSLQSILEMVNPSIPISLLKVDAQGHDVSVVLSCGKWFPRIERVQMEAQDIPMTHFAKMYPTAMNTTLLHAFMTEQGMNNVCCRSNNAAVWEVDCMYIKRSLSDIVFQFPNPDAFGDRFGRGFYDKVTGEPVRTSVDSFQPCERRARKLLHTR